MCESTGRLQRIPAVTFYHRIEVNSICEDQLLRFAELILQEGIVSTEAVPVMGRHTVIHRQNYYLRDRR